MNVGALNFAYDTKDTPATLTVTFAYRKWVMNETIGPENQLSGAGATKGPPSVLHTINDNMAR